MKYPRHSSILRAIGWAIPAALVLPGTPEELAAEAADPRGRNGVNIPGSLAPGQKRTFEISLEGKSRNADARKRPLMKIDKFYTARVATDAKGDDQPNNNGANLTFRLDASGQAVGPMFTPRATSPARGTVEVRAPGS